MKSKKACSDYFNSTLYKKNLTRFWPLWGMASFIGALFPLYALVSILSAPRPNGSVDPDMFIEAAYGACCFALPVISLLFALCTGTCVWNYLFGAKSTGLAHSLPIKRDGLFLTNFLSGLTIMNIPFVITGLLTIVVQGAFSTIDWKAAGIVALIIFCENLFFFSLASFCAMETGHAAMYPAVYLITNFLAIFLDFIICTFSQGFIVGYASNYTGKVEWLSPVVYIYRHVQPEYTEVETYASAFTRMLPKVQGLPVVIAYAAVGVVIAVLAMLIYRRRRSECTGDVIAIKVLKPVFQFGVAIVMAIAGGMLLYVLFATATDTYNGYYKVFPMFICMIIAGAIGFYGAKMMLEKKLKVFGGSLPKFLVVAAACLIVCLIPGLDILHIEGRVPDLNEIESINLDSYFRYSSGQVDIDPEKYPKLAKMTYDLHCAIVEDIPYIRNTINSGEYDSNEYVRIEYTMKDGTKIKREYRLPMIDKRIKEEGTYENLYNDLAVSKEMILKRLYFQEKEYKVDYAEFSLNNAEDFYSFRETRNITGLYNALIKDIEEGNYDPNNVNEPVGYLFFNFETTGQENYRAYNFSMDVDSKMVNVLEFMKTVEPETYDDEIVDEMVIAAEDA